MATLVRQEGHALHVIQTALIAEAPLRVTAKLGILLLTVVLFALLVLQARIRQLLATENALHVLITRLLLVLGQRHSPNVRAVQGSMATLVRQEGLVLLVLQARIRQLLAT